MDAAVDAVARRLLAAASAPHASGTSGARAPDPVAAAERVLADLADTLAPWFGVYGYRALLTRSLVLAQAEHPVLASVRVRAPTAVVLDGLAEAAEAHGPEVLVDGVAALVAAVTALLGRVIGDDMALNLVEGSMGGPVPTAPDYLKATGTPT